MIRISRPYAQVLKRRFSGVIILFLTFIFFLYKGLQYLIIGSYLPLLIVVVFSALMIFSKFNSGIKRKTLISIWSVLIMIWSVIRLLLAVINGFVKQLPEAHISHQLGISGSVFSLIMLAAGIYLWTKRKQLSIIFGSQVE